MQKTHSFHALYIVLCLTILFYCLDFYFRLSPSLVVLPLANQYHTNAFGIGTFASAFYLGYVLMQIPAGIGLDRYPLRFIFSLSMAACTLSFIGFIYATHLALGLILRFILGAFSAFSFISVLYVARHYLPPRQFTWIASITISIGTLAASLAQILNAALLQTVPWHQALLYTSLTGLCIAAILYLPPLYLPPLHLERKYRIA